MARHVSRRAPGAHWLLLLLAMVVLLAELCLNGWVTGVAGGDRPVAAAAEPVLPAGTGPVLQVVYRQLLYLVVVQSTVAALLGGRQRWLVMARTGLAAASIAAPPTAHRP